jgi:hypothetical protein
MSQKIINVLVKKLQKLTPPKKPKRQNLYEMKERKDLHILMRLQMACDKLDVSIDGGTTMKEK